MEYRPDLSALAKRDQSAIACLLQKKGRPAGGPLTINTKVVYLFEKLDTVREGG
jgi:hypothetical protein